jgi:ketosteroid isomerase-like protein
MIYQPKTLLRVIAFLALAVILAGVGFLGYNRQPALASPSVERSLVEASQGFSDAFVASDPYWIASYFANDIVAMYPDIVSPVPTVGYEANLQNWIDAYQVITDHPITSDGVVVANSKDVGYSYGRWAVRDFPGMGDLAGRWVATWEWTKDGWKITVLSAHIHEDIDPFDILGE